MNTRPINVLRGVLVAATALLAASGAHAVTIGFEGVAPAGGQTTGTPYSEGGYTMTGSLDPLIINGIFSATAFPLNTNGSDVFGWSGSSAPQTISLAEDTNALFSLTSVDASNLILSAFTGFIPGMAIDVTGFNGASVVATANLAITPDVWMTYSLTGFTGLTSVAFMGTNFPDLDYAIDNIVVGLTPPTPATGVSEPGTLAIIGFGLAGLGFMRRKRAA